MKTIKVGSDFSGVGAFDFAINRVADQKGFKVENVFACDWDKFARQSYLANHKEPGYYPHDVYERDVPEEPLDVYMSSPPCQGFSICGSRKSKDDDKRNILFYNSHEFIKKNNPRYFIFENVTGLISHDNGNTFQEWINLLGGKSVNGLPVLFPHSESVPYHIYHKVLNSKNYGIPQNRKRIFIIGIRDNIDNNFKFPKKQNLNKTLKDILTIKCKEAFSISGNDYSNTLRVGGKGSKTKKHSCDVIIVDKKQHSFSSRELFRLQDFDDSFKFVVSDAQLYKQAGNSITIKVLEKILLNINL